MDFVARSANMLKGMFGFTDAFAKEHAIQDSITGAAALNCAILLATYLAHTEVLNDLTLRVYFNKSDSKRRCMMAATLWFGVAYYLVVLQRRHTHILPTMALYTGCLYAFMTVLVHGAYSAGELH